MIHCIHSGPQLIQEFISYNDKKLQVWLDKWHIDTFNFILEKKPSKDFPKTFTSFIKLSTHVTCIPHFVDVPRIEHIYSQCTIPKLHILLLIFIVYVYVTEVLEFREFFLKTSEIHIVNGVNLYFYTPDFIFGSLFSLKSKKTPISTCIMFCKKDFNRSFYDI